MAAVDSLLRFISARNADALTIISGGVPELRKAGTPMPLSMPPLSEAIVAGFLAEIGGESTTSYSTADGSNYSLRIENVATRLRMTFTPSQTGKSHSSPPAPTVAVETAKPLTGDFAQLLEQVADLNASDLILSSDSNSWVRIDGAMQSLPGTALTEEQILDALGKTAEELEIDGSLDFAFHCDRRYRVNLFRQSRGIAAALRPIRQNPPTLQDLNLPYALHELVKYPSGLVLIAGTAGSGKSTTVTALIEHLNCSASRHIITLEDPVEYQYQSKNCLIHQREIGSQVRDFSSGLRSALRESPDIIVVGEMRDRETIAAAITAAETGHLVLGTIHASDATVAIDRMIDSFPGNQQQQIRYQLSYSLRATVTQELLQSSHGGRVPAVELMQVTDAVAANIRDNKTYMISSTIQSGRDAGMISLELSLARLVRNGHIDQRVAMSVARVPDVLNRQLR